VAELGSGAAAGTAKEAAQQELVVLATKWWNVQAERGTLDIAFANPHKPARIAAA